MNTRTTLVIVTVLVFASRIQHVCGQESASQPDISPPPSASSGDEPTSGASFGSRESANIPLRHTRAEMVADQIRQLYADIDLTLVCEEQTNLLLVSGRPAVIAEVKELVANLDQQKDASLEQLEAATRELAKEYRTLENGKLADLVVLPPSDDLPVGAKLKEISSLKTKKLRDVVKTEFEARQRLQRAELSRLQQELQSIQRQIDTREQLKDEIIDKRVEELINPDIQWDAPPIGPGSEDMYPDTGGSTDQSAVGTNREPAGSFSTSQSKVPAAQPVAASPGTATAEYFQIRDHYVKEKAEFQFAEAAFNSLLAEAQKQNPNATADDAKKQHPAAWQAVERRSPLGMKLNACTRRK